MSPRAVAIDRATHLARRTRRLMGQRTAVVWFLLLVVLLVAFLGRERAEIDRTAHVLREAHPLWVAAVVALELAILGLFGLILRSLLRALGFAVSWREGVRLHVFRTAVGTLSPASGPSATYVFAREVGGRGIPADAALLTLALNGVVGYASFAILLVPILLLLHRGHGTSPRILGAAVALAVIVAVMVAGTALLLRPAEPPPWLARRMPRRVRGFAADMQIRRIRWRDLGPPLATAVVIEMLGVEGRRERGFTLGAWEDDYIRASAVMAVEAPHGEVVAFANLIHDGVPDQATIDLMRRRTEPDGVMDFLFAALFEHLKADGFHSFSLGLSPLAFVGTEPGSRLVEQALHQLYEHLNRVFAFKGLHEYKDKFHPLWEPEYLVYRNGASLPMIALALVRLTE